MELVEQLKRLRNLKAKAEELLNSCVEENYTFIVEKNQEQLSEGVYPSGESTPEYTPLAIQKKLEKGTLFGNQRNWSLRDSGDWWNQMYVRQNLLGEYEVDTNSLHKNKLDANPAAFHGLTKENTEELERKIEKELETKLNDYINGL